MVGEESGERRKPVRRSRARGGLGQGLGALIPDSESLPGNEPKPLDVLFPDLVGARGTPKPRGGSARDLLAPRGGKPTIVSRETPATIAQPEDASQIVSRETPATIAQPEDAAANLGPVDNRAPRSAAAAASNSPGIDDGEGVAAPTPEDASQIVSRETSAAVVQPEDETTADTNPTETAGGTAPDTTPGIVSRETSATIAQPEDTRRDVSRETSGPTPRRQDAFESTTTPERDAPSGKGKKKDRTHKSAKKPRSQPDIGHWGGKRGTVERDAPDHTARAVIAPSEGGKKLPKRARKAWVVKTSAHEKDLPTSPINHDGKRLEPEEDLAEAPALASVPGLTFGQVSPEWIIPNLKQPRQVFDEDELDALAASLGEVGMLQPVVVRRITTESLAEEGQVERLKTALQDSPEARYELIMGERRWRAAQRAQLETIPIIVRDTAENDLLREALIENIHRVQLNALEEAAAYQQLMDDFGYSQEQLARRVSKSRPQVANILRLLRLPASIQRMLASGVITPGHARALLALDSESQMRALADRIVSEGISVRATEELVRTRAPEAQRDKRRPRPAPSEELLRIADEMSEMLSTTVKVSQGAQKGRVVIEFADESDLERIFAQFQAGRTVAP